MSGQIACQSCNASNSTDASFCNSCGKSLLQTCRSCGVSNPITSSFCKSCGIKLSVAIFGATEEQLENLNGFTSSFPGYGDSYLRHKSKLEQMLSEVDKDEYQKLLVKIVDHIDDHNELLNLSLKIKGYVFHISDIDWQVNKAIIDKKIEIKQGYFSVRTYSIYLLDYANRQYARLYHEHIAKVECSKDTLRIVYSGNHSVDLCFCVPRATTSTKVISGLFSLFKLGTEDDSSPYQRFRDDKLEQQRQQRLSAQDEWADAYIKGWFDFFTLLVNEKKKR